MALGVTSLIENDHHVTEERIKPSSPDELSIITDIANCKNSNRYSKFTLYFFSRKKFGISLKITSYSEKIF